MDRKNFNEISNGLLKLVKHVDDISLKYRASSSLLCCKKKSGKTTTTAALIQDQLHLMFGVNGIS